MKRTTKVLSLLLAWMLLFNSMVFSAVSEEALPVETETASDMSAVIDEKYEAGDEIVEWREEGVKHYYLGDGQYQAVITTEEETLEVQTSRSTSSATYSEETNRDSIDTHISSSEQSRNFGDVDGVRVGTAAIGLFYNYIINFPKNVKISTSSFHFAYYYNVPTGYMTVGAYAVDEYWDELEVTWDHMEVYPNMGISTTLSGSATLNASSTCNADNPTWASVNITNIVQSWYSGERYNEGIALKRTGGTNNSVIIKSYESAQETYRPYYTINYSLLDDIVVATNEYYIKNSEFGKYVQIDNNSPITEEGAKIEIWDLDNADDQKWEIIYLYNGYYKILSCASGKALTSPTDIGASITQKDYTGTTNQQWRITRNTDGLYKISPRSHLLYYMAAGDGIIFSNGRNVEKRANQSDGRDEWSIELIYDAADLRLDTRVYFNSTVPYSVSEILEKYNSATAAFYTTFGIKFNSPSIHHSDLLEISEDCDRANYLGLLCSNNCGSEALCSTYHHRSASRLLGLLSSDLYYTYRLVGSRICIYDTLHKGTIGLGDVNGKNAVTSTYSSDDIITSIQHELTHNLGGSHSRCTAGQECVLKGDKNIWCDACTADINKNLN